MDLKIVGAEASAEERAAVDAVLGPPHSGWRGAERDMDRDGRTARGGREATAHRDLLLPAFHGVQDRIGWVSHAALNYICERLTVPPAEAWGVLTFYHLFATAPQPKSMIHVCDDLACRERGGESLCAALERELGPARNGEQVGWQRSPCLGLCEKAPAVMIVRAAARRQSFDVAPVRDLAQLKLLAVAGVEANGPVQRLEDVRRSVPQTGQPGLRLLKRAGIVDPESLSAYRAAGGYDALARAFEIGAAAVIAEVNASKLVGRGGAAFPTGRKWEAVARAAAQPRYLVCNADESEPGTFKDRVLLEGDPFAIVEAMTIAGFATGCERGFIYLRGEYPLALCRLENAIAKARKAGLLGENVLGRGLRFDLEIRRGAGAYICGEETALFNSIEGKRGEPRSKPPFPVEIGLFGKPTVVNNVETLASVPGIVLEGGAAYAAIGTAGSAGSKLFCLSGSVKRPGVYEVPFGTTLGELLELSGGVPGGRTIQAILLGGAAGMFVGPDTLSTPLTFEGARAAGATLGSGVVMIFDDTADLGGALLRIAEFFRHESCGQCVPCRVGTVRQEELLHRLRAGRTLGSRADELALLRELGQAMRDASICGLGQTASSAVESALARLPVFNASGGLG